MGAAGFPAGGEVGPPVVLTTVWDPVEAEIIISKLRSAGIETMVRRESLSVVVGLTVDGLGQQEILVRPSDLEEARAALELSLDDGADETEEADEGGGVGPATGGI